jgi:hypothetical protein
VDAIFNVLRVDDVALPDRASLRSITSEVCPELPLYPRFDGLCRAL